MTSEVACLCPSDLFPYCSVVQGIVDDLMEKPPTLETFDPHRHHLPDPGSHDGILVTGSKHHVYDEEPWMEPARGYVEESLRSGVPALGICFGHQLIADALGGEVERMEEREMGFREIELTEAGEKDPVFEGVPERFVSFTTHLDTVREVPGATVLAENDFGLQAYRHDDLPAHGIQFHPEYGLEMAYTLLGEKELTEEQRREIESRITEELYEESKLSRRVLTNFFEGLR